MEETMRGDQSDVGEVEVRAEDQALEESGTSVGGSHNHNSRVNSDLDKKKIIGKKKKIHPVCNLWPIEMYKLHNLTFGSRVSFLLV